MNHYFKQFRTFLVSLRMSHARWCITLFFSGLFAWSMYLEAYRTMPAISILMGAVTTNLPTVVLLFYVVIVFAHNFVNVKVSRGKGSLEVFAVDEKKLSELEADETSLGVAEEVDIEINEIPSKSDDDNKG